MIATLRHPGRKRGKPAPPLSLFCGRQRAFSGAAFRVSIFHEHDNMRDNRP